MRFGKLIETDFETLPSTIVATTGQIFELESSGLGLDIDNRGGQ